MKGALVGLVWAFVSPLQAVELTEDLAFSGFYGVDATYSDAELRLPASGGRFTQYDPHTANLKNSIVGGQIDYDVSNALRFTVQGSAYVNAQDDLTSSLDWAYLSYDLGNDTTLRAGKFQIPMLQGTELKRIGFSRLWARPVEPNNGAGGFQYHRGVELLKHISQGEGHWDFQLVLGEPKHDLEDEVDGKHLELISARYSRGDSWVRAAVLHDEYEFTTRRGIRVDDSARQWIYSIEGEARFDRLILTGGYSDSDSDYFPNDRLGYLSLGYQLGRVTPFVLLTHRLQEFQRFTVPQQQSPGGPPPGPGQGPPPGPGQGPPPGPGAGPPIGINRVNSVAIGTRWFLTERTSIKFQLEHHEVNDRSRRLQTGGLIFEEEGNTFSIVLEGVF